MFSTESNYCNRNIKKKKEKTPNSLCLCFYSAKKKIVEGFSLNDFELATQFLSPNII